MKGGLSELAPRTPRRLPMLSNEIMHRYIGIWSQFSCWTTYEDLFTYLLGQLLIQVSVSIQADVPHLLPISIGPSPLRHLASPWGWGVVEQVQKASWLVDARGLVPSWRARLTRIHRWHLVGLSIRMSLVVCRHLIVGSLARPDPSILQPSLIGVSLICRSPLPLLLVCLLVSHTLILSSL